MEKVPDREVKAGKIVNYLPHQAVVRKSAETTKVRMVFDASSKESRRGVSLNDCLQVGPPWHQSCSMYYSGSGHTKLSSLGISSKLF